jgi:hypothetical protein
MVGGCRPIPNLLVTNRSFIDIVSLPPMAVMADDAPVTRGAQQFAVGADDGRTSM